jgi:hypothetical protein
LAATASADGAFALREARGAALPLPLLAAGGSAAAGALALPLLAAGGGVEGGGAGEGVAALPELLLLLPPLPLLLLPQLPLKLLPPPHQWRRRRRRR